MCIICVCVFLSDHDLSVHVSSQAVSLADLQYYKNNVSTCFLLKQILVVLINQPCWFLLITQRKSWFSESLFLRGSCGNWIVCSHPISYHVALEISDAIWKFFCFSCNEKIPYFICIKDQSTHERVILYMQRETWM